MGGQSEKIPAPAAAGVAEVVLGPGCAPLPERLLLAHAQGEVLFLAGAGVSMQRPACLPSFRDLVLEVYRRLNDPLLPFLEARAKKEVVLPRGPALTPHQEVEASYFEKAQLDVVLGMLERRIDDEQTEESRMRRAVVDVLQPNPAPDHAAIHTDLIRLSDRGDATTILTTNFDLLLEAAAEELKRSLEGHALGAIPSPSLRPSFSGVLHIHGALRPEGSVVPDLILTDRDFGEFYLRRRVVPDLLYDAARIYHLVLVGYTANDPPVRYLLDAISADDARFPDLKERFVFVPFKGNEPDQVEIADWKGRGVTPVPYSSAESHRQLAVALEVWADLFENTQRLGAGNETLTEERVRETIERITESPRREASDVERGLFDHLIRRSGATRRAQLASCLGELRRSYGWLDAMLEVIREPIKGVAQEARATGSPSTGVERNAAHCVQNFALGRLEEEVTITWARGLLVADRSSRRGLQRLLSRRANWEERLPEPWSTAWQLVEESWRPLRCHDRDEAMAGIWEIKQRLERGDRSLALTEKMAEFVAPWVRLEDPEAPLGVRGVEIPAAPAWGQLFRAELRSVDVSELHHIDLNVVSEVEFLSFLVGRLETAVRWGLDLGRFIGWEGDFRFLRLGGLIRVHLVRNEAGEEADPDLWGIAVSVKLLHTAVERLAAVNQEGASKVVRRWLYTDCPVHLRLWAALARDGRLATPTEVGEVLLRLTDREFWSADLYPELTELRAVRFADLEPEARKKVVRRVRKGPRRDFRVAPLDARQRDRWSREIGVRELKRIEVGG